MNEDEKRRSHIKRVPLKLFYLSREFQGSYALHPRPYHVWIFTSNHLSILEIPQKHKYVVNCERGVVVQVPVPPMKTTSTTLGYTNVVRYLGDVHISYFIDHYPRSSSERLDNVRAWKKLNINDFVINDPFNLHSQFSHVQDIRRCLLFPRLCHHKRYGRKRETPPVIGTRISG